MILQEQSQIGGAAEGTSERIGSARGATELAMLARGRGARTVLYLTWGREHGDPDNADFATYEAMQDRLDTSYLVLAESMASRGIDVDIAPVGGAFRLVREDVLATGADPEAEGSDFDALYEADGSHPSPRGAYLAACVIAARCVDAPPSSFPDEPALGAAVSEALRGVCARAGAFYEVALTE